VKQGDLVYFCAHDGNVYPAVVMRAYSAAERTNENDDLEWAHKTFSGVADLNVMYPNRLGFLSQVDEDENPRPAVKQYGSSLHVIPRPGKFTRIPPPDLI
jgi:hypothetical protein